MGYGNRPVHSSPEPSFLPTLRAKGQHRLHEVRTRRHTFYSLHAISSYLPQRGTHAPSITATLRNTSTILPLLIFFSLASTPPHTHPNSPCLASASCFLSAAVSMTKRPTFFAASLNFSQSLSSPVAVALHCHPCWNGMHWLNASVAPPACLTHAAPNANPNPPPLVPFPLTQPRNAHSCNTRTTHCRCLKLCWRLNSSRKSYAARSSSFGTSFFASTGSDVLKKSRKYFSVSSSATSTTGPCLLPVTTISNPASCAKTSMSHLPPHPNPLADYSSCITPLHLRLCHKAAAQTNLPHRPWPGWSSTCYSPLFPTPQEHQHLLTSSRPAALCWCKHCAKHSPWACGTTVIASTLLWLRALRYTNISVHILWHVPPSYMALLG